MILIDNGGTGFQPRHRRAIVTLVVGEEYARIWKVMCEASWQAYAERWGYDLLVITEPLDASPRGMERSFAWQKLLILDQPWSRAYERIVWIDADILISDIAPDIVGCVPDPRGVGVCICGDQMSEAEKHIYVERMHGIEVDPRLAMRAWAFHEGNRMTANGVADESVPMLSTGVLVLSPQHHNEALLETYARDGAGRLYEQPHMSEVLHRRGLVQAISPRFNWLVHEVLVLNFTNWGQPMSQADTETVVAHMARELEKAYFLHYAGSMNLLRHLAQKTEAAAFGAAA
ncbi:MAG: hypothetical protein ABW360_19465 [Phenylobacterium sp.]